MLLIKLRSEVLKMQNSQAGWMVPEAGKGCFSLWEPVSYVKVPLFQWSGLTAPKSEPHPR